MVIATRQGECLQIKQTKKK